MMKAAIPAAEPRSSYVSRTPARARSAACASGSTGMSGGSCATRVITSSGYTATSASAVVGDHGAVREMRRQRSEAAGIHWLADHDQRWVSIGGRQRAVDVVDEVDIGSLEHLRSH